MSITGEPLGDPEKEDHQINTLLIAYDAMVEEREGLRVDLEATLKELRQLQKRKRFRERRV